jgi:hypothetical protein
MGVDLWLGTHLIPSSPLFLSLSLSLMFSLSLPRSLPPTPTPSLSSFLSPSFFLGSFSESAQQGSGCQAECSSTPSHPSRTETILY